MLGPEWWRQLGPGLLFAAAAVGVSHLVLSTRAGAQYGLGMVAFILFGLATKYPYFRFGQQYSAITGMSLVEGFRRLGKWALALYALITVTTMFAALAAVALVTSGLAQLSFGLTMRPQVIAVCLIVVCSAIVLIGRYHWLDIIIKLLMAVLAISTAIATIIAVPSIEWSEPRRILTIGFSPAAILFTVTLVGWMPAPLDTAIWQSLWTLEKSRDLRNKADWRTVSRDFHIGYVSTAVIAICFLILGNAVMFGSSADLAADAAGFAAQLVDMYVQVLGPWTRPVISITALAVMLSTVLVVLDGYPRSLVVLVLRCIGPEQTLDRGDDRSNFLLTVCAVLILDAGAIGVLAFLVDSFALLIGVATAISFMTTPVLAWLIHRVMTSEDMPSGHGIGRGLVRYSQACILFLAMFALVYLYLLIA
jgi:Mn2+/Fe2+ NRAMP family transporter